MAELLLFAWDHATRSVPKPSAAQLVALPKRFDLIAWRSDGWKWGTMELAHPWFRIIAWAGIDEGALDIMLAAETIEYEEGVRSDSLPALYRTHFLDFDHPRVPAQMRSWFADERRVRPVCAAREIAVPDFGAIKTAR